VDRQALQADREGVLLLGDRSAHHSVCFSIA
jgi:hypothetical protein